MGTSKTRKQLSEKSMQARKKVQFLGGKALKGTLKQKEWAEKIRFDIVFSGKLTDEEIKKLLECGGFTEHSAFWIANRDVAAHEFKAESIVKAATLLRELECKHYDTMLNGFRADRKISIAEIKEYMDSCVFSLKSNFDL